MYRQIKEDKKIQNNIISAPKINLSIRNKKIVEYLSPPGVNKNTKSTFQTFHDSRDKEFTNKTVYKQTFSNTINLN